MSQTMSQTIQDETIQGEIIESTTLHHVTIYWYDETAHPSLRLVTCEQIITVILNTYDEDREFYDIQYEWIYDENEPDCHPFAWDDVVDIYSTGEPAVWRNKESDSLVKYLVMNDNELSQYSGEMSASHFRSDIIRAIASFWEHGGKWFEPTINECVYLGDGEDPPDFGGEGWTVSRYKQTK